jgi:hypothetical protein
MYNMEISIGSYSARLEIVILIVILFWVMFGHVLCSCCTMTAKEGFAMIKEGMGQRGGMGATMGGSGGFGGKRKEAFSNLSSSAFDTQFSANNSPDYYMNPNDWAQQSLVYTKGTTPSAAVESIWDRSKTQKPPAKGQLSFYDNINFKPECCVNSDASTSTGCACYTVADYNLLKTRGGNNVPFSDL